MTTHSTKMPALFVGHGSPMNVLEANNAYNVAFRAITQQFAKPTAILCVSAHWYSNQLALTSSDKPELIYDFYGFPDELYQVQYPVAGSIELAEQVQALLQPHYANPIELDEKRGLDHGAWAVLKHLYPEADVPVVQLSLNRHLSLQQHFELAAQLKSLRKMGVLVLGSGDIVHNLRVMTRDGVYDWADAFRQNINQAIEDNDVNALVHIEQFGRMASLSVPTPEHYLPLLYVMALRESDDKIQIFNDVMDLGSISMTSVLVG